MKKKQPTVSVLFMLFSILFCVCLIAANLFATKQIALGNISVTGGLIIFPISYIVNDCVCEVWGYKKTRLLIWVGFAMNFFFVLMGALCDLIPAAPYYTNTEGFHGVFGLAPRVAMASFCAFLVGSFLNAYVMSSMKIASNGNNFSARAILSTIAGEGADSLIFFPLALGGVVPTDALIPLMLWQVVLKTVYEVIALPLTIRVVKLLKAHEGEDVYDNGISYNVLNVLSI
jgi:uncharacterized integral membrane protein (TIGR00697 family)